jgi:hypothetical protein
MPRHQAVADRLMGFAEMTGCYRRRRRSSRMTTVEAAARPSPMPATPRSTSRVYPASTTPAARLDGTAAAP